VRPENEIKEPDEIADDPSSLEIEVLTDPRELDGYDLIWRISTESSSKAVIEAGVKLLIQMHHEVTGELEEHIPEYEQQYIDKCFIIIQDQIKAMDQRSEEEQAEINLQLDNISPLASFIQRLRAFPVEERRVALSLNLLRQMIRASEKDGTYSVRPHSSLAESKLLDKVRVFNNIKTGSDFRTSFELRLDSSMTVWDIKKLIGQQVIL